MARNPQVIGCDGGSTDPGPHYLGSGTSFCSRLSVKRDLKLMLQAAVAAKIPCIIGTSGGAGGEPHLQDTAALVREIAREEKLSFKMALIHAEQDKAVLTARIGRTKPLAKLAPFVVTADHTPGATLDDARLQARLVPAAEQMDLFG